MLWDLVRDFFVQHVFGGYDSLGNIYGGTLGLFGIINDEGVFEDYLGLNINDIGFDIGLYNGSESPLQVNMSIGDYLSTIATIISITIIVVLCALFIWKIVKLVGGLLR